MKNFATSQLDKITPVSSLHPEGHKLQRGSIYSNNITAIFNRWIPAFARITREKLPNINQKLSTAQSAFTLIEHAIAK